MKNETLVIFKKELDGKGIVAVFPTFPGTGDPFTMACYAHVGQHSSCDTAFVANAKPAKPAEYASLLAELIAIGYEDLKVVRKHLQWHTEERAKQLRAILGGSV